LHITAQLIERRSLASKPVYLVPETKLYGQTGLPLLNLQAWLYAARRA
jgi:hypothetical protein